MENGNEGVVVEVEEEVGGGMVGRMGMGWWEGVGGGVDVKEVEEGIEVGVGKGSVGGMMKVVGEGVEMKGEMGEEEGWGIEGGGGW